MRYITAIWDWCNATSFHAYVAIFIFGAIFSIVNLVIQKATTANWDDFAKRKPRLAGVFYILKGLFPLLSIFWKGVTLVVKGALKDRAEGGPPKPLAVIVKEAEKSADDQLQASKDAGKGGSS